MSAGNDLGGRASRRAKATSLPTSIAGFPARAVDVDLEGLRVRLLTVRRLEDYVDTEALLRDADAPEPPYWAHLWPGSRALARLLATRVDCRGKRLVEVGCGLGLVGVVAALRGAEVTMFDYDAAGVAFARANAEANGCRIDVRQADLHATGLSGPFDLVCAADVTYDSRLQTALADFAAAVLAPGGQLLCAESVRTFDRGLQDACARHGLRVSESELREPDEGADAVIRLTRAERVG